LVVKGALIADLRPDDIVTNSKNWKNRATASSAVGDFVRADGASLTITTLTGPNGTSKIHALAVGGAAANALLSAKPVPSTIQGAGSVSVETWVNIDGDLGDFATTVAYGVRANSQQRQFLMGNHPFAVFFNDLSWADGFTPTSGWHYLAYVFDSKAQTLTIYIDAKVAATGPLQLDTKESPLLVGVGPDENSATTYTTDPFNGYIAVVRVETGVLSADDVKDNFDAGVSAAPEDGMLN
jgi:hypothetical protein